MNYREHTNYIPSNRPDSMFLSARYSVSQISSSQPYGSPIQYRVDNSLASGKYEKED